MTVQSMIQRTMSFWRWFRQRVVAIYVLMFFVSFLMIDYYTVIAHAKGATLSRFMPSYDYLMGFMNGTEKYNQSKIEECTRYYKKVTEYISYLPDAHGLLGFCYYQLGKPKDAISAYKKAIDKNPGFINFYYNLGVIYFLDGRFRAASEFFSIALQTTIENNLNFLTSSKLYFALYSLGQTSDVALIELKEHLKEEYVSCYKALVLCHFYLGNFTKVLEFSEDELSSDFGDEEFFLYYAGVAAYNLKNYKKAIEFFKNYAGKNSKDFQALYYLGSAYRNLGQNDVAVIVFKQVAALKSANVNPPEHRPRFSLLLY